MGNIRATIANIFNKNSKYKNPVKPTIRAPLLFGPGSTPMCSTPPDTLEALAHTIADTYPTYTKMKPGEAIECTRLLFDSVYMHGLLGSSIYIAGSSAKMLDGAVNYRCTNFSFVPNDVDVAYSGKQLSPKKLDEITNTVFANSKRFSPAARTKFSAAGIQYAFHSATGKRPTFSGGGGSANSIKTHIYVVDIKTHTYCKIELFNILSPGKYLSTVPFAHDGILININDVPMLDNIISSKITSNMFYLSSPEYNFNERNFSIYLTRQCDTHRVKIPYPAAKYLNKGLTPEQIEVYTRNGWITIKV